MVAAAARASGSSTSSRARSSSRTSPRSASASSPRRSRDAAKTRSSGGGARMRLDAAMRRLEGERGAPATPRSRKRSHGTGGSGGKRRPAAGGSGEKRLRSSSSAVSSSARPTASSLREALKTLRSEFARRFNTPSYCVFPDSTLDDIALRRPTDEESLLECHGVGPGRCKKFGSEILSVVNKHRQSDAGTPRSSSSSLSGTTVDGGRTSSSTRRVSKGSANVGGTGRDGDKRAGTDKDKIGGEGFVMEETLTMEQVVDKKFKDAEQKGHMISIDDDEDADIISIHDAEDDATTSGATPCDPAEAAGRKLQGTAGKTNTVEVIVID